MPVCCLGLVWYHLLDHLFFSIGGHMFFFIISISWCICHLLINMMYDVHVMLPSHRNCEWYCLPRWNVQGGDGFNHYKVRARMAIMEKNFKLAESIYLEQVCFQKWLTYLVLLFNIYSLLSVVYCLKAKQSIHVAILWIVRAEVLSS